MKRQELQTSAGWWPIQSTGRWLCQPGWVLHPQNQILCAPLDHGSRHILGRYGITAAIDHALVVRAFLHAAGFLIESGGFSHALFPQQGTRSDITEDHLAGRGSKTSDPTVPMYR
jgi:hypothetical protein